jgi:transposase
MLRKARSTVDRLLEVDTNWGPVRLLAGTLVRTADLREMGSWLVEKGVRSVAMQSTGVYWMPVFEILEQQGLEVYLVNAQHTKNVPGRKSDVQECQWLLKLHAFGLLNNSFQPTDEISIARTLWRQRSNLVAEASSVIQRMQKVLT